ncbi:hypothetical protein ACQYWQ_03015 [Streptomyces sp. P6-2-1]|uniref:hypothetical protein n=1 Tax=unclassified Streptomyces TaxID=2593676 RepID=UPI003D35AC0C
MTSPALPSPAYAQLSAGPRPAPGPAADEGLARRLRALACTAPLHDLDTRKANLAGEYTRYAMAEVALAAIDLVTLHMDFDTGADHEQIVARLLPRVGAQAPARPVAEHERVARWVLENLINVGSADRGFRAVYGTFAPDGSYVRRDYDFKLIEEVPAAGGTVFLRATDEAVNVLVGALDTDVTSAQIAAEVKLEVLISRGRLADAQLAAEQARYRTVQYAESLRRALESTRRDVRAVDWLHTVPDLIDEALGHVADRYRHENAILTNIRKARDESEEPENKRRAAELVDIVKDCIRRHTQLQSRLLEAGPLFRAEQDRQAFADHSGRPGLDLYGQLLSPVIALPVEDALRVTDAWFARGTGLRTPGAVRVGDLVDLLLTPPAEREHLGAELPEPDLVATPDDSRFSEEQLAVATELLRLEPEAPRRLSGLLAEARRKARENGGGDHEARELARLVTLLAFHAASPPVGTAHRQGEPSVLFAVDDGTPLDDPDFGGADLIVGTALLEAADAVTEAAS